MSGASNDGACDVNDDGSEGPIISREVQVRNELGLHARPAMQFAEAANRFPCEISVVKPGDPVERVDGKSVMGMLTLAATQGTTLLLEASGENADAAIETLAELFDNKFGETQ